MKKQLLIGLALASLLMTLPSAASTLDEFSRAGKWEVFGYGQYISIPESGDADADIYGGGIGFGYNALDQLNINGDISVNSLGTDSFRTTLYMGSVAFDFNILKKPLTPLITAGGGAGFDEDGETLYSANVGAGVRYDVNDHVFLKAVYRATWFFVDGDTSELCHGFSLAIGYRF